jgi:RecA/RadA recombinase
MSILKSLCKDKKFKENMSSITSERTASHLSTMSYALNGILSGNVFKGILDNTITALVGPSNSGKSLILAHLVKDAIDQGHEVVIFDSERAVRKDYYEKIGCDVDKIFRVPVGSTLEFRNRAFEIIEGFYEKADKGQKLFVGLDSLGNLASDKELADVEKNKTASDQGSNAKNQNSALRVISSLASKYDFPCIFTNHVYAPIGDMFAQRGVVAGGSKAIYCSHSIIYFERLMNKEEVEDAFGKMKKTQVGIKIKATTIKNREFPEEQSVTLNLRYDSGINPYSGLLPFAIRAGAIENKSRGYLNVATGKTIFEKDLYNGEVFNNEVLEKINEFLSKNTYSNLTDIFSTDVSKALGENNGDEEI